MACFEVSNDRFGKVCVGIWSLSARGLLEERLLSLSMNENVLQGRFELLKNIGIRLIEHQLL